MSVQERLELLSSDALGWTAQGIEIVRINEDEKEFGLDRIGELIKEYDVRE